MGMIWRWIQPLKTYISPRDLSAFFPPKCVGGNRFVCLGAFLAQKCKWVPTRRWITFHQSIHTLSMSIEFAPFIRSPLLMRYTAADATSTGQNSVPALFMLYFLLISLLYTSFLVCLFRHRKRSTSWLISGTNRHAQWMPSYYIALSLSLI